MTGLGVVCFVLILLVTLTHQTANAQNSTSNNSNIGTAKAPVANTTAKAPVANGTNKTVVIAAPGAAATVVTTGNKTIISTAPTPTSSNNASTNFNRTGFTNLYLLKSPTGKTFPIKFTIKGGKIVGMLADKDRTTMILVINPSANGGNFTIELPRNVIDSKGASNADTKYQIKIDGKGVDYKEVANNVYGRILAIDFSKDNRFIEIIGTQMAP